MTDDSGGSGAGGETTGRNVTGNETDHVVSSSGDTGDQLSSNAALAPPKIQTKSDLGWAQSHRAQHLKQSISTTLGPQVLGLYAWN